MERILEVGRRFYMDFGFMRASSSDYTKPNKKLDRVVDSWDGYSSYLLIVDEASRYIWVFLTRTKEPPLDIIFFFFLIYNGSLVLGLQVVRRCVWVRIGA